MFVRLLPGETLVQVLVFFPCNLKPETASGTGRLLHLLNKDLDLPGFGMDEEAKVVFYRLMVPIKDKKLDKELLHAFLDTCQLVCKTFVNAIVGVAYGSITFEQILEKAKEQLKAQGPGKS